MLKLVCIAALVTIVVLALTTTASARLSSCNYTYGHGPKNDRGVQIGDVTARNMPCSRALKAIARGDLVTSGFVTPGFRCHVVSGSHVGSTTTGQEIACVAGRRGFRFGWAT